MHKNYPLLARPLLAFYPVLSIWIACLPLWAQPERNLLTGKFQEKEIVNLLLPRAEMAPFPNY